ncbi:MAG: transcription-repair coupling factor [Oscillospiraceae bacterium]|jgi:transcription-repair coupling factor (superfamily II helicase)|nr:transcription-repair coupling factor [Oscillospiraceae bacterium]
MMQRLSKAILNEPEIARTVSAVDAGGCPALISGLTGAQRAHLLAAVRTDTSRPVVYIAADELELRRAAGDLSALTGERVITLTPRDFVFRDVEGVSREFERRRLDALLRISGVSPYADTAQPDSKQPPAAPIVVTTAWALMQRAIPKNILEPAVFTLSPGETHDIDALCARLITLGYSHSEQTDSSGQFARRGGIVDIFTPAHTEPVRAEFFGDEIDSLTFFDAASQRRGEHCPRAVIVPAAETLASLSPGGTDSVISALETLAERVKAPRGSRGAVLHGAILSDLDRLRNARSFPAADRYLELIYPFATGLDYLPENAVVLISEPARVKDAAERAEKQQYDELLPLLEAGAMDSSLLRFNDTAENLFTGLERFAVIMSDVFAVSQYPIAPRTITSVFAKQLPSFGGSLETAAGELEHYINSGYRTVLTAPTRAAADALARYLTEKNLRCALDYELMKMPAPGAAAVAVGALSGGMEYPSIKLAVLTEGHYSEARAARPRKSRAKTNRERVQSFTELNPGDLVVHDQHGIGRFIGIFPMLVDGVRKDYIKIAYAGSDSLYIPATQLDSISKYIGGGGEDSPVALSKMGGAEWTKAKTRARGAARDIAKELIALYAARQRARGHAFAPDSAWQREFEDKFGYAETEDQLRCIEEIKRDMERGIPMDRLLCGDVGYGKTEVALRAVMKCVEGGFQAAILVPTTVLARQHFITISKRFAGYPVNIEVLSRFRTPAQIRKSLKNIQAGIADIIIGTHRLLQKDIEFRRLGLLVVDEEQRFGVTHKERLKALSATVDVLTLSATPIPRTLNMALSGIRDMSVIEEPPTGRQPVQTYVLEHDWGIIRDAIMRETSRGGQTYYLHNRIETIDRAASRLNEMLNPEGTPENERIAIAVAHGQMDEESLSDVMERVSDGDVSVLVCTTIIEAGIDIPNVNTLIVEDADKLGLSQLHQIRGRVGRSPRRAYAYLTFRRGKVLTEISAKRLEAVREFAEFNAGFKIAMRDLELRGAGNLLGADQSGHMMKLGYDMYLKLLEEAVAEERGEKPVPRAECTADLSIEALLPESYVPSGAQRVDLYRRIARVRTEEDSEELIAELIDRYGDPPTAAVSLVRVALLRAQAAQRGISEITQKDDRLRIRLTEFDLARVTELYAVPEFTGRLRVEAGSTPAVSLSLKKGLGVLEDAERFVAAW